MGLAGSWTARVLLPGHARAPPEYPRAASLEATPAAFGLLRDSAGCLRDQHLQILTQTLTAAPRVLLVDPLEKCKPVCGWRPRDRKANVAILMTGARQEQATGCNA